MQIPKRKSETRNAPIVEDPYVTPAAMEKMKKELERLEKFDRKTVAEEVARMAQMGDFSENAGYQMAKQRLRGINTRILVLQERLKRAIPIKTSTTDGVVRLGMTVTIKTADKEVAYTILGSLETNPSKGYISQTSPLGAALLGQRVGDVVFLQTPQGNREYTILKIE